MRAVITRGVGGPEVLALVRRPRRGAAPPNIDTCDTPGTEGQADHPLPGR